MNLMPLAFQWKGVETILPGVVSEETVQRQLITLHRIVTTKDKLSLTQLVKNTPNIDMTLPMRGVTALSLALFMRHAEITRELLGHMERLNQLSRALNVTSVDNAGRRETPLITAARTGQSEAVGMILEHKNLLNLEAIDGEGRTALWHAVREEQFNVMTMLVEAGAKVYYERGDLSCPLQLALKTTLLKLKASLHVQRIQMSSLHNSYPG